MTSFAFVCLWITFSALTYLILFINQQELLSTTINAETQLLENLIGWELTGQIIWAALISSCIVGLFFTITRLKEGKSTYNIILLVTLHLGFFFAFEYCLLKLLWSYQLTKKYEDILGVSLVRTDVIQNFLFTNSGAMSYYGMIIIPALLGFTAVLLTFLVQGTQKKAIQHEEIELLQKAHEIVEEKPETNNEDLKKVEGIGTHMAEKLFNTGIRSLRDLAESDPEKVAESLDISIESASIFINAAGSLIRARKTAKRLRTE